MDTNKTIKVPDTQIKECTCANVPVSKHLSNCPSKPQPLEWEERFDSLFSMPEFKGQFIKHATETQKIKTFISTLLSQERKKVTDRVEDIIWQAKFGKHKPNLPFKHEQDQVLALLSEIDGKGK